MVTNDEKAAEERCVWTRRGPRLQRRCEDGRWKFVKDTKDRCSTVEPPGRTIRRGSVITNLKPERKWKPPWRREPWEDDEDW